MSDQGFEKKPRSILGTDEGGGVLQDTYDNDQVEGCIGGGVLERPGHDFDICEPGAPDRRRPGSFNIALDGVEVDILLPQPPAEGARTTTNFEDPHTGCKPERTKQVR